MNSLAPNDPLLAAIIAVVVLSVALLAWLLIDIGSATLERYRASFTERAGFQAAEFFLFIDARKLFLANLAVMALGGLLVWLISGSELLALPAFFALGLLPRLLYRQMRKRRLRKFEEQLPDALMMLSGGLRAGLGLSSAMAQLVAESGPPLSQEFSLMLREQRLGVTLEQALSNLNHRMPTQTTVLITSAMRIANETGGGLAETLERTSATIRSRLRMQAKIGALTAQGKLQAWVVGALPIALMLILNEMEPQAMSMLWHTRVGWATLAVIALFEFLGVYVIRKIIAIDV
ncbi:type II secretion system F family protein [Verminephrobacter eiseniae]|uniref:Type II secretion system protein n=1 Tax=Verminephrobacter eiseniae (strain EF01-2) TaxID=391735 RepID=A1WEI2_VEREI|nr:type II secretion system F family protein [Verminephrobacter eiseniae]ABM56039.1 type II secretion system protein [Verminephrobacter eiseniae EF01-2]MCW5286411.1 pilus assembly protein [Verminephrobacter eiseniae]MCW5304710.1 pilus assembly protein [Verminephrobacter eiseniae]MCW8182691.1 pilus assembly protein [Verminephrobacter eiseniae]MCW8190534.1 pilus assembly protein [Verminephrobacter eiseniae]